MNLIRRAKSKVRSLSNSRQTKGNGRANGGRDGGTDILSTLKQEHEEVAALLEQLVGTDSGPERKKLVKQIKSALVPHLRAEEKVVYRSVSRLREREARQDGAEGALEHKIAEQTLIGLGKMTNATSPEFSAAAKVLKELVQHHVKEEEQNIWKDVREHFSDDDRLAMNDRFESEKSRVRVA